MTSRGKALVDSLWYVIPLAITVLVNAVVRPFMASALNGEMVRKGASVRGSDTYWVFDAVTRSEHPWQTRFLETSDGALALVTLAVIAVLFVWRSFGRKRR